MKKGIAAAGSIVADVIKKINRYPSKGMLCDILSVETAVGGCVSNTLASLAMLDKTVPLYAFGKVGDDMNGKFILNTMQNLNIDTAGVKISATLPTGFTDVMSEEESGERTFFCADGANAEFKEEDLDVAADKVAVFHAGYVLLMKQTDALDKEYGTVLARIFSKLQAAGIKTSVDTVSRLGGDYAGKLVPVLKYCNYVIMNEIEACAATNLTARDLDGNLIKENIYEAMRRLFEFGVSEKVVVHCPEGGFIADASGKFEKAGSLVLPDGYIKGSVGAGDAFCAGCLYSFYQGYDDRHALEFAISAAACNLSRADSYSGIRTAEETEKTGLLYKRREI